MIYANNLRFVYNEAGVVEYVQNNAAVQERINNTIYAIRHPTPFSGGRALISEDTRELVKKLCLIYRIPLDK